MLRYFCRWVNRPQTENIFIAADTVNHSRINRNAGSTRIISILISADCLPKSAQN
jgi:hypothetical protein